VTGTKPERSTKQYSTRYASIYLGLRSSWIQLQYSSTVFDYIMYGVLSTPVLTHVLLQSPGVEYSTIQYLQYSTPVRSTVHYSEYEYSLLFDILTRCFQRIPTAFFPRDRLNRPRNENLKNKT
jgi:hypothetical protein